MWAAAANISIHLSGNALGSDNRRDAFVVLVAFLASFGFIRMSTRLMRSPRVPWWPGSVKTGGVHVHHLVFGIVLLMVAGFLEFAFRPDSPWQEILAAGFGIGIGLTLDEFALWLHLEDVYWAEEGRRSIDAVIIAAIVAGAVVVGVSPLGGGDTQSVVTIVVAMAIVLGFAAIAALKGKYWSALVGTFIPLVSLVAAIRLAKPDSPWGRRRYPAGARKLARATARAERSRSRYRRWQELIGGRPSPAGSTDEA
jgi:lysyl-tRNA synthetase class 2